jgi:aspartyl-tRNA(Asn)/glutamyl-tRNA(Gln) amidotransferase subunit B
MKYEMTIGIECHVQLKTKTKLFSPVDNDDRDQEPNSCVSPIDYALPGMLPRLNQRAVEYAVRAGLALGSKINLQSRFDRKHYYYPDLPKGYQISQFYAPIIGPGLVRLPNGHEVRIEHAHMEEDAGKLTHHGSYSLVDLNRAGTPLIEIVSMPDIHSAEDARLYAEELHRLMTYARVTRGDLYHGNMRFDVNISLAPAGSKGLGTRAEIKNLNSFRSVERAALYEYERQAALLDAGEKVKQETRGWSDAKGKTTAQRSKEHSQDYRYMPDPDIPPIHLEQEYVDEMVVAMPILPPVYREVFRQAKISHETTEIILDHQILAERLAEVLEESDAGTAVKVANLFVGTLLSEEHADLDLSVGRAEGLIALAQMNQAGELSSTATKQVLIELYDPKNAEKSPRTLAQEMNLLQENDTEALEAIVAQVLADPAAASAVADIKNGELKAIGFLIGLVMKQSGGKANPAKAREVIVKKVKGV